MKINSASKELSEQVSSSRTQSLDGLNVQVVLPLATKVGEWIELEEKENMIALTIGVETGGQIVRCIAPSEAWSNTFVGQFSCVAKKVTPFVWMLADEETAESLPKIFNRV